MLDADWKDYCDKTRNRPPRALLVEALPHVKEMGKALDLGAGALNDSSYLLSRGFCHVIAVDKEMVAESIAKDFPTERFSYLNSSFADFRYEENRFHLVNAQFSLPFIPPETFGEVFQKIVSSLAPAGVFVGQFFGDRDEWNTENSGMTFHSIEQARDLLAELEIIHFEAQEEDRPIVSGEMKHWHIINFIAKRKGKN